MGLDFTVSYEPAPDEVARALYQGLKRQLMALYGVLCAVLVVAGSVCVLADAAVIGVGMLVAALVAPPVATWVVRRIARHRLTYLCVPSTLRVTNTGYECRTDRYTTTMRWSMFGEVRTTPEFWLFFVNKQIVGFLPKRAFAIDQQAELGDFLSARQNARAS
jgi:YcxB-like protein